MKLEITKQAGGRRPGGFSLVEVMIAITIISIVFMGLYSGITAGVGVIQLARENLRGTQILVEHMEIIRVNSWDQLTSGTNLPTTFRERYYPAGPTNQQGLVYYGNLTITNVAGLDATYSNEMRLVVVTVQWTNQNVPRVREMRTLVARNGMQNYVY